jgi:putative N6-adenine-specific DNA methylase
VTATHHQPIFAACAPGLEPVLATELRELGLTATETPGGVEAHGEDGAALVCLASRVAETVRLRVYDGPGQGFDAARAEALRRYGVGADLHVRRARGRVTLSVDAAGEPLHRRGWRARIGAAPLRETLAAALLRVAGWSGDRPFLDPMCGSGTLAIEAALMAARRAPGLDRTFAFERFPGHDARRTARLRERLRAEARPVTVPIHASDRNMGVLRLAQKNAAAAGVEAVVRFERADAAVALPPPGGAGVCAVNPPFGVRLDEDAAGAWRSLGQLALRLHGWTLVVLGPDRGLERLLPLPPQQAIPVRNGGLACQVLTYRL